MTEYSISEALNFILETEKITTKDDLDKWCGGTTREKLYNFIKFIAPTNWGRIKEPKACVRAYYEHKLIGYKAFISKPTIQEKNPVKEQFTFTCISPAGCIGCHISKYVPMPLEEAHKMMDEFRKNVSN